MTTTKPLVPNLAPEVTIKLAATSGITAITRCAEAQLCCRGKAGQGCPRQRQRGDGSSRRGAAH